MPVAEEAHSRLRRDLERKDLSWQPRREGDHARRALRRVLGHEDRAAAERALEHAADAATAAHLRRRLHHDRLGHPGELSSLGEQGLTRVERDLEHGHGGADDPVLHQVVLRACGVAQSLAASGVGGRTTASRLAEPTRGPERRGNMRLLSAMRLGGCAAALAVAAVAGCGQQPSSSPNPPTGGRHCGTIDLRGTSAYPAAGTSLNAETCFAVQLHPCKTGGGSRGVRDGCRYQPHHHLCGQRRLLPPGGHRHVLCGKFRRQKDHDNVYLRDGIGHRRRAAHHGLHVDKRLDVHGPSTHPSSDNSANRVTQSDYQSDYPSDYPRD